MNRLLSVKNIIASMLLSFLMGCSVQVKNHTPLEFPLNIKNVLLGFEEFLYPESKQQFFELSENPAHRFFLEVKPKNVSIVHAYISINGTEYVMEGSEKGLWTYESPNECQANYSYHFRVRYKAGLYGYKSKTYGSDTEPFNANVSSFGNIVWYTDSAEPNTSIGDVGFYPSDDEPRTIYVQNLQNTEIDIFLIGFSDMVGIHDNSDFEILNVPTLPVHLNCGDRLGFQVKWNPPEGQRSRSIGALCIHANAIGGNLFWTCDILLKGSPGPS